MKYHLLYKTRLNCDSADAVFEYLISSLKHRITHWDYFINWAKVFGKIDNVRNELSFIDNLIGKDNIKSEFVALLQRRPQIASLIPALIASRDSKYEILDEYGYDKFSYKEYEFQNSSIVREEQAEYLVEFAEKTGVLDLLKDNQINSIIDYLIGVEVGLDTHGRKGRTGNAMENIVDSFIKDICTNNKYEYIKQATAKKIADEWNVTLEIDKTSRIIDFAIYNKSNLYLVETNFYRGVGSKLKSTAGEYRTLHDIWNKEGHKFIWITDGYGWKRTRRPLHETFNHIDHLLNLDMVSKYVLQDIIAHNL